jgi:outer membrane protein TolC
MLTVIKYIVFSSLGLISTFAQSSETLPHQSSGDQKHEHGTHRECELPKSINDIFDCARDNHPEIRRALLTHKSLESLPDLAGQRPNPTLNSKIVKGKEDNRDKVMTNSSLMFALELGDKRNSRINVANSKIALASAKVEQLRANITIATALNLHKLRQVHEQKKVANEMVGAFKKIIKRLSEVPRLSASQEASLSIFKLALADSLVKRSELFEEERELEHFFHVSTGHSLEELKPFLPKKPKRWPTLTHHSNDEQVSPRVKKLISQKDYALSMLKVEQSKAWPTMKIGPSISYEKEDQTNNFNAGLSFSIPLPIFHANGGGRKSAQNELKRSQKFITIARAEESHERAEQLRVYNNATRVLKMTASNRELEKIHKKVSRLYDRGLVESSTLIESFRQWNDFLKGRHERELTAINALYLIYNYDGKISEVSL